MRIGMIHQPHFLPWPGYIARCLAVDVFVVLDNVKFKKNHFHQRTKYISVDGRERWLSFPVAHSSRSKLISEVVIASTFGLTRWQRSFREAYRDSADFELIWPQILEIIQSNRPSLYSVTYATLVYLLETMAAASGGKVPAITLASSIDTSSDRTMRLVDLCADQEISHLVMGRDALASHDGERLRNSGLALVRQVYHGPTERAPRAGVTVLDDVFRSGRVQSARRLCSDWGLEPV